MKAIYKATLSATLLMVAGVFADSYPTDWWSNRTDTWKYYEAMPEAPRLENANNGYVEGIVSLPQDGLWEIKFTVRSDETYNRQSDYTKVYINSELIATIPNYPSRKIYPVSHKISGNSFTYRFESHSAYSNFDAHQVILPGTVTALLSIGLEDELNSEGCVEATDPEGATIHLFAVNPFEESSNTVYNWINSIGDVGSKETFEFDLGLAETTTVTLVVEDTATGKSAIATKTVCVSDTTPPEIRILSPVQGDVFIGNNLQLEVIIMDIVDQDIPNYTVTLGHSYSIDLDPDPNYSNVRLLKPDSASEPVPTDVTVTAEDFSGNQSSSAVQVMLRHDNRQN